MHEPTDEELLLAIAASPGAIAEFYLRQVARVTGMGVRRFDSAEDVADFVATVILEVGRRRAAASRSSVPGRGRLRWTVSSAACSRRWSRSTRAGRSRRRRPWGVDAGLRRRTRSRVTVDAVAVAPVAEAGFFGAPIPDSAMDAMMIEIQPGPKDPPTKDGGPIRSLDLSRVSAISVPATDAAGHTVAHGITSPD